jgi:hypothetical protein
MSIWYEFQYNPPLPVSDTFDQYVKFVNYNVQFTINIYRMSRRSRSVLCVCVGGGGGVAWGPD